jgi:hypothetical protein
MPSKYMIMKRLYTLVILALTCCAIASTQGIQGKITDFGIFRFASKEEVIKSPETPSGVTRVTTGTPILVCATNIIPAKIGLRFGMAYEISSVPGPDRTIDVTKIARHPRITKPDGTAADGFTYVEKQNVQGGKVEGFTGYGFDHDYELVTGDWEFEIQYGGQTMAKQKFTVVKE